MVAKHGQLRKGQTFYTHNEHTAPDAMHVTDLPRGYATHPSAGARGGAVSPNKKPVKVHKPSGPVIDGPRSTDIEKDKVWS